MRQPLGLIATVRMVRDLADHGLAAYVPLLKQGVSRPL